jgi:hypothetical protein
MSDGPHRSLPLRKPWKNLAKRGDQHSYDATEVAEAATYALASDFKNEVKPYLVERLKAIFNGHDNSLQSPEIALQDIEDSKRLAAGSGIGMNLIAHSIEKINDGHFGEDAFHEALGAAIRSRGYANANAMEEHYVRESNQRRASHVKARIVDAISSFSDGYLGSFMANGGNRLRKKVDIDEGVLL